MTHKISGLFRYPVKSMGGEELNVAQLTKRGILGDRTWAVVNLERGEIQGGRKLPKLMRLRARFTRQPTESHPGVVMITFPDENTVEVSEAGRNPVLSDFLGVDVALHPLEPATNLAHYRLAQGADEADLRRQFDLRADEELPDFSKISTGILAQLKFFATPPGTYFDAYPLHLLTTGALKYLQQKAGLDQFNAARYRPNVLIETNNEAIEEFDWVQCIAVSNNTEINIDDQTVRCSVPGREHFGLPEEKKVVQAVAKLTNRFLGVYATVRKPGTLRVGDEIFIKKDMFTDISRDMNKIGSKIKGELLKFLT